jgi:hypothetical protein
MPGSTDMLARVSPFNVTPRALPTITLLIYLHCDIDGVNSVWAQQTI